MCLNCPACLFQTSLPGGTDETKHTPHLRANDFLMDWSGIVNSTALDGEQV